MTIVNKETIDLPPHFQIVVEKFYIRVLRAGHQFEIWDLSKLSELENFFKSMKGATFEVIHRT